MKFGKILCLAMLAAICFIGCQKKIEMTEGSEKSKTENTSVIRVGVLKIGDSLPIYIGDREGIFKENGANVEIVEFGSASDQSKAMESGAIDGMMTDMIVQTLIQKGGTEMRTITTALGATVKDGKFLVVGNKDAGIIEAKDLEGKSIAISEGTMMEYLIDSYCKELGIDITKVKKVNIPSLSLRFETLMAGRVDAAIFPDPLGDMALQNGCTSVIDDTTLKNNASRSVIAFNNEFIKQYPEEIEKFINGYNAAIDRLNEYNESDIELIHEVAKVNEVLWKTWRVPNFTKNSVPTEEEVENVLEWMANKKLIKDRYGYSKVVNPEFCKEAE